MANRNYNPPIKHVTFHVRKDRKNRDGTVPILTLVRHPSFDQISKTFTSMEEARAWAQIQVDEFNDEAKRKAPRQMSSMTIQDLINEYFEDPEIEALKSYEGYADLAQFWVENYTNTRILDFSVAILREARDKLINGGKKKRAPATVNRRLSVMRSIWNWGRSVGLIPLGRIWPERLLLPEDNERNRFLTSSELAALLKAAEADPLMRAAILVSIATGVRQGELLRLTWADVNFAKKTVTIHLSKNETPRQVHVGAQAIAALKKLKLKKLSPSIVFALEGGKPLKQSWLEVRWRRIRDAAGLVDFKWHDLRHTHASYLAQNGATLLEIGSRLGHKSPKMTARYSHLVQGAPIKADAALNEMLLKGGK
jgi:integrase